MDINRIDAARALRAEAELLEKEAARLLPKKWKIGMRVRFIRDKEWAWCAGAEATVVKLSPECHETEGNKHQVFWTTPDSGYGIYWTTPNDVELISAKCCTNVQEVLGEQQCQ